MAVSVCVILVSLVYSVLGYSSGPPTFVCSSMTPNHSPNVAQTSTAPYSVTASATHYNSGDVITVTLKQTGVKDFHGFLLQARPATNNHVGNFNTPAGTTNLACGTGNAVSHNSDSHKNSVTLEYTAPDTATGDITFVVTVVQSFTTFWVQIGGPTIRPSAKIPPTCNLPSGSMSLVELSRQSIYVAWEKPSDCATSCQVEFRVRADVSMGTGNKYVSIGFSKDHLMVANEERNYSTLSPTYHVSDTEDTDTVNFDLGYNFEMSQGHDSVVDCIEKGAGATVGVQASYNQPNTKNNVVLADPNAGLTFVSGSRVNGILECRFKRSVTVANPMVFDLDARKFRLLVATGNVLNSDEKGIHLVSPTWRPVMSTEMIDFLSPGMYSTLN